ncbi:MAG TPA: threonine/serine dehydratase [Candidatus Binatia bacterium]|nr:threonine/serine dehydratase [Candidatus Binatia bacterium]
MRTLELPSLDQVRAARERIRGVAIRTPLLRLNVDGPAEIWLKCENLQPIGSFKLRGAGNAMALLPPEALQRGVYTASAGNMAQGVAWCARRLGIPCSVVVPDHAPAIKTAAIERLGASVLKVPFPTWWRVMMEHRYEGMSGTFIHPFSDPAVLAGNGTIALEILEDLPDPDAVLVPYGGGGLSTGIAAVLRALAPRVRVHACEIATAAPLAVSLAAGAPSPVEYTPSFVDGIGGTTVFEEVWPHARELLAGSLVVSLEEAAAALRLLVERNRLVAEGAGAVPVAAALRGLPDARKIVCVVSGGNIDPQKTAAILSGKLP